MLVYLLTFNFLFNFLNSSILSNGIIIEPFSFVFNVILTSELYNFLNFFKLEIKGSVILFSFDLLFGFLDLFAKLSVSLTERDFFKISPQYLNQSP